MWDKITKGKRKHHLISETYDKETQAVSVDVCLCAHVYTYVCLSSIPAKGGSVAGRITSGYYEFYFWYQLPSLLIQPLALTSVCNHFPSQMFIDPLAIEPEVS